MCEMPKKQLVSRYNLRAGAVLVMVNGIGRVLGPHVRHMIVSRRFVIRITQYFPAG